MPRNPLIPSSPTAEDYAAAFKGNEPPWPDDGEPFALFEQWLAEAKKKEPRDENAMALATVDDTGMPDVRMVLLKDFNPDGFTFFTNLESEKARHLAGHPNGALLFYWKSLSRQVRVRGRVERVSDGEADAYFATRSREARIGAWASAQSRPLDNPLALETKIAGYAARFGVGPVPRPAHWGGYRLTPLAFEFWRERPFRLHDRLAFARPDVHTPWARRRLFP